MEIFKIGLLKSTLLKNISDFVSSLTIIDIVFFFSVILLMILLVTLLYFIKLNEDVIEQDENVEKTSKDDIPVINEPEYKPVENSYINIDDYTNSEPITLISNKDSFNQEMPTYNDINNKYDDEEGPLLDLKSITKALETNQLKPIDLDEFEEQQERDAIISYDELLKRQRDFNSYVNEPKKEEHHNPNKYTVKKDNNINISYKKESYIDDVSVKEVDLDSLISETEANYNNNNNTTNYSNAISYEEEEQFLNVLKELQNNLN